MNIIIPSIGELNTVANPFLHSLISYLEHSGHRVFYIPFEHINDMSPDLILFNWPEHIRLPRSLSKLTLMNQLHSLKCPIMLIVHNLQPHQALPSLNRILFDFLYNHSSYLLHLSRHSRLLFPQFFPSNNHSVHLYAEHPNFIHHFNFDDISFASHRDSQNILLHSSIRNFSEYCYLLKFIFAISLSDVAYQIYIATPMRLNLFKNKTLIFLNKPFRGLLSVPIHLLSKLCRSLSLVSLSNLNDSILRQLLIKSSLLVAIRSSGLNSGLAYLAASAKNSFLAITNADSFFLKVSQSFKIFHLQPDFNRSDLISTINMILSPEFSEYSTANFIHARDNCKWECFVKTIVSPFQ